MFGITILTQTCEFNCSIVLLSISLSFVHKFAKLSPGLIGRMSTEMVACIAIEAISILEKMHLRG